MIFLDGVGLGDDDPAANPFCAAEFSALQYLSNGYPWLRSTGLQRSERATFVPTDPRMGVDGKPQSGTGQAAIITGRNVPQIIGRHYGPKPDAETRSILDDGGFFRTVRRAGKNAALLEAYPERWQRMIQSRKRLPASYQYAAIAAGVHIMNEGDLLAGRAISGDWTGEGWHRDLGLTHMPVVSPYEAGRRLVSISRQYDFSFMAHWMTDIVGHRGPFEEGVLLLKRLDRVLSGVLDAWDDDEGLVIITSDHGNLEDLSHRHHTENDVPTVIIGNQRDEFAAGITALYDLVPAMGTLLL